MAFVKTGKVEQQTNFDDSVRVLDEPEDFVLCKNPHKLERLTGKSTHYISDGDWSMHDLVMQLLQTYKPAELFITTYALREFPVRQLILAQERKELLCVKMLLDYRAKARTPEVFQLAEMNMNKIYLTSIHAKVTVLRSAAGCVSIVGSANWTQNPRVEAGVITLDKNVAEFHINWIEKIMDNAEIFN